MSLNHLTSRTDPMKGVLNPGCRSVETEIIYMDPAIGILKINDNAVDVVTINSSTGIIATPANYDIEFGGNVSIDGDVSMDTLNANGGITSSNPTINFVKPIVVNLTDLQKVLYNNTGGPNVNVVMKAEDPTAHIIKGLRINGTHLTGAISFRGSNGTRLISGRLDDGTTPAKLFVRPGVNSDKITGGTDVLECSTTEIKIPVATQSTSTSSGALVVQGGVGVAGRLIPDTLVVGSSAVNNGAYITPTTSTSLTAAQMISGIVINGASDNVANTITLPAVSAINTALSTIGVTPAAGLALPPFVLSNSSNSYTVNLGVGMNFRGPINILAVGRILYFPVYTSGVTLDIFGIIST